MADILFTCPKCSKNLTIDDKGAGRAVKCPDCGYIIVVPRPEIFFDCPACNCNLSAPHSPLDSVRDCPNCHEQLNVPASVSEEQELTCPKCDTALPLDARFCVKCGYPLNIQFQPLKVASREKSCPYCDDVISADSVFCVNCKTDLRTGERVRAKRTFTEDPERVLKSVSANLFRNGEAVGGCLKITSQRLLYESHALNLQSGVINIPLSEIKDVTKYNTLGIIPNGMHVTLKSGVEYQFAVFGRGHLIPLILSLTSNTNVQASTASFDNISTPIWKYVLMGVLIVFIYQIFKGCDSSNSSSNSANSDYAGGEGYDLVQKLMDVENTLGMGVSGKDWDSELNSIIVSRQEHATQDGRSFNSTSFREGWHLGYNKWMKDHPAPPQYRR